MIRLFTLFLLCITSVTAADQIPAIPTFSHAALQEIFEGKPSQALCFVKSDEQHGSGALVSLDGNVCIVTSAHLGKVKSVTFLLPDETSGSRKLDSKSFAVKASFSMPEELHSTAAQNDVQILLVDGNPENDVKPLTLTSEIDTSQPMTSYGFGNLVAEFFPGRLSVSIPARYKLDKQGKFERMGLLPAKVIFDKYNLNPIASWFDKIRLGITSVYQQFQSQISIAKINPTTSAKDGVILATTAYDPTKLQTHIGGGFSGGPVLQNDNIVGIFQGGSLKSEDISVPLRQKLMRFQFLSMWGLYLAGHKIAVLQKIAPFFGDPIMSPSIKYILELLGYTYLSTPMRLCLFNTALFVAVNIYLVGNKMYAGSQHALKRSHEALFVHMTSEIIHWIQSKLAESSSKLNTAS